MDLVVSLANTKFGRYLNKLLATMENPEPLWEAVGAAMSANTKMRINDGKDIHGTAFIPSYRVLENGGQTLRDKGHLQTSITYLATKKGCQWGVPSEFPYATILNFGGIIRAKNGPFLRFKVGSRWVSKKQVTIPRRQFMGFSKADKQEVLDMVYDYLGRN
jgi:phage gpG-like protein